jgi:hypothetical protein
MVRGLSAGGRWIRTFGSAREGPPICGIGHGTSQLKCSDHQAEDLQSFCLPSALVSSADVTGDDVDISLEFVLEDCACSFVLTHNFLSQRGKGAAFPPHRGVIVRDIVE